MEAYHETFDVVVDASGSPGGLALAAELVRPLGTIVLKTTCAPSDTSGAVALASIANAVVVKELRILGSRCGPHPMALELLGCHDFQVHKFVEAEYPLARAEEAMEHARRRGALKVVLVMPTHAL